MPRGASITVENAFSRGLITENTPMNFPEQAVTDTLNCVYSEFGEITRRPGMDYELGATGQGFGNEGACVEYEWFSVENSGSTKMVVQQMGNRLSFYRVTTSSSLSAGYQPFFVDLTNFASSGSVFEDVFQNECQFTTGRGYLFVTHPFCDPFYIDYMAETNSIVSRKISFGVRDVTGIEDGLQIETRPADLSDLHRYNLFNQGWYDSFNNQGVLGLWRNNPMTRRGRSDWPSNADIWWLNKRTALREDAPAEGNEIVDFEMANRIALGNTPAPKGHFVFNPFYLDRSGVSGIPGIPVESSGSARPTSCVFYAGRVWYAGVRANKYSSKVYFSQLVERDDQFGKCYQINDPTSETTFDIIDTDGGTIELPLIEEVTAFRVMKDTLLVIGTNGIYSIRGSDSGPFRATNYIVEYVSDVGIRNAKSIINVETGILWWGDDAIYTLGPDQIGASFQVQNLSKSTIQSFIDRVPTVNKRYIKGAYSKREQIVRWIYSNSSLDQGYNYDSILEMNVTTPAFYPYRLDSTNIRVGGIIVVAGQGTTTTQVDTTTIGGEPVTTLGGDYVTTRDTIVAPRPEVFKFLTKAGPNVTYSELSDMTFVDWKNARGGVGATYNSYAVSGFRIRGELLRKFTSTPVVFTLGNEPDASLVVEGIWDYGERTSLAQELYYKYIPDEKHTTTRRVKIRGKGRALQLRFTSQGDRPFRLLGWATFDTGGTMP